MGLSLDRAHSSLTGLGDRPPAAAEFSSRVASALRTALPFDGWCLFGLDPLTGLRTVGAGDDELTISAEAQVWLDDLVPGGDDQTYASDVTRVLFDAAHAARRHDPTRTAAALVRTVAGHWLRVEAATSAAGRSDVMVVLHAATAGQRMAGLKVYYDLSPRESQIVDNLAEGLAAKQIAHRLGISVFTVTEHLRSVYRKFAVCGREELLAQLI